jgi:capsular polysaccharide transport system permease protein
MLNLSEELVNRMSERSRQDLVSFSRSAVAEAENRLQLISQQLLDLRNRHGILDPQKYASVNLEQTAKLQEEITTLRAQVAVQRGYLSEDSPSVQLSLKQIEALEQELKAANAKITSANPGDENALSLTLKAFEQIQTDRDFAQKAYQASLAALQSAQADAARQSLYLDTIIAPTLAQEQYYPRPIKNTLFFLVLVFCGWVLVLLLGSSIRDHM